MNILYARVVTLESIPNKCIAVTASGKELVVPCSCPGIEFLQENTVVGMYFKGGMSFSSSGRPVTRYMPVVMRVIPSVSTGPALYDLLKSA